MVVIQARNLKKSFGEQTLLNEISFNIQSGEKIGLVGWNGSGKTTLVKILLGHVQQDSGSISTFPQHLKIGYLPQSTENQPEIHFSQGEDLFRSASQLGLHKLQDWEESRLSGLSGGERLKLSLAHIWAEQPEFLVLDEPTNHLDMIGVEWLVQSLHDYKQAALIISHDRFFLDQTVTKIFELEDGKLTVYEGNYTAYRDEKERRRSQQLTDYTKQQRKIERIEQQVATLKQWSEKAHREAGKSKARSGSENRQMGLREFERAKAKKKDNQIKSKLARLDLELSKHKIEKPKDEPSVTFAFESNRSRGKRVLEAKGLTKEFDSRTLFSKSHFYIKHGERIALLGANGSGKTTFIKMLLGEEAITKGTLWKSDSLQIAYLSQDVNDLPVEKTAMEYLNVTGRDQLTWARTLFANMGIKEELLLKPIGTMSLGERTRIKLVYMILQDYDMLILDEPTNHLDLPSREQMEETLSSYSGTLLIVSHDRYFSKKLCDKLLIIENERIKRLEMGLNEYEDREKQAEHSDEEKDLAEKLALLETKITELLGRICMVQPGTEEYIQLDTELNTLMEQKKAWNESKKAAR